MHIINKQSIMINLWRIFLLLIVLSIWEISARNGLVDTFFLSQPTVIIKDFVTLFFSGEIFPHMKVTLQATFIGLGLGSLLGIAAAFFLVKYKFAERIFDPIIVALHGIPKIALGPLFILWFGLGIKSKIFLALIAVFFIMYFNAYGGFKSVEPRLINAVRLMGASQFHITTKVLLPSSLPWILTGFRAAVGLAFLGAIIGEFMGSTAGLGYIVQYAGHMYNITRVFSTILVMTFLMMFLNEGVKLLEKNVLRWRPQGS
jgi:NitT/TauT family transport system permease protein